MGIAEGYPERLQIMLIVTELQSPKFCQVIINSTKGKIEDKKIGGAKGEELCLF